MARLFAAAFALFCLSCASARQIRSACQMTSQYMEEQAMGCLAHDPGFMLQVIENMQNPKKMESMDFICRNKNDIVDLALCMEKKMAGCLPAEAQALMKFLPNKQRLEDTLQFVCDHSKEIMNANCMEDSAEMQEFLQCYMGQVQSLAQTGASTGDLKKMVCSIIRLEESCLRRFHGTCSKTVVELMIQTLEKLFPTDTCPVASVDIKNGAFGNVLVHGQPLLYQPNGERNPGYGIVN